MAITISGDGITSANIADGTITNTDINASAAIDASKLTGTGKVLQVVSTVIPESGDITTTSTSYVDSGIDLLITPTSTSSNILLLLQGGGQYVETDNETIFTTIYRDDTTNIGGTAGNLSRQWVRTGRGIVPHSLSVIDSPSTTSQVKYSPYFRGDGGYTVRFKTNNCGDILFIAMEIAG